MKNISKLSEIFNIEETPQPKTEIQVTEKSKEFDTEDDYQLARQTMRKLLLRGDDTLEEIINLAKNSEHPRTYEVAGQLMKTLSDVSKDLLGLQKQVKELEDINGTSTQQINTQNNVVFAGSTHELMKLLGKKDDGNTIES